MNRSDFHFDLPEALIARYPKPERTSSRLLMVNSADQQFRHGGFTDILEVVQPGDLLVLNNTCVIKARLYGQKASGGGLEALVERIESPQVALLHVKASRAPKMTDTIYLGGETMQVLGRESNLFRVELQDRQKNWLQVLDQQGEIPLPPYITREVESLDEHRYQTVYNQVPGAVAAPTAGLHFDEALLGAIKDKGVDIGFVTLHVGAGTFQPVKVERISEHHMHKEYLQVSTQLCEQVNACKTRGGRVIAVGTTSVRCLETAANYRRLAGVGHQNAKLNEPGHQISPSVSSGARLQPYEGETDIFIYPGYRFQCVDLLLTNFHLPESTLIMLVCAFAGYQPVMEAYQAAVNENYRFFSYGDAMLLSRAGQALW